MSLPSNSESLLIAEVTMEFIDGSMSPPDKQEIITVTTEDKGDVLNVKKAKL